MLANKLDVLLPASHATLPTPNLQSSLPHLTPSTLQNLSPNKFKNSTQLEI